MNDTRGNAVCTVRVNDAFTRELLNHNIGTYQLLRRGEEPLRLEVDGTEFH